MNRYLHTIFCDDVRLEAGNKQSLMGIYSGDLWVSECPIVLPKLCIVVNLYTPKDKPFKNIILRILRDEEVLIEAPMTSEEIHQPQANIIENGNKDSRGLALNGTFVLSPFSIEKECVLRVRAETESEELKGAGLRIKIGRPQ